jgi:uncharacterized OsmC-like protein
MRIDLVSLGGCFTSHLLAAIRARQVAITNVRVAVTGTSDGTPERLTAFSINVSAECQDSDLARWWDCRGCRFTT